MQNKTWQKWSDSEIELLKYHWKKSSMEELLKTFPNRKYSSLMLKATELKIKSEVKRKRKGRLDFLDTLNEKSSYWWGFIIADGHLTKRGELVITLNEKDKDHLTKLAIHLDRYISLRNNMCTLRIQDKLFGQKWLNILNTKGPKTYFPPDLSCFFDKSLFISFFIGLIDGDGCIWLTKGWPNLRVELHINWFSKLEEISNKLKELYNINCKVKITKKLTAKLEINTKQDLKILKEHIKNVEFLERKWSKLDYL